MKDEINTHQLSALNSLVIFLYKLNINSKTKMRFVRILTASLSGGFTDSKSSIEKIMLID